MEGAQQIPIVWDSPQAIQTESQSFGIDPRKSKHFGFEPNFLGSIPKSWEFLCFFILEIGDELGFFGVNWDFLG